MNALNRPGGVERNTLIKLVKGLEKMLLIDRVELKVTDYSDIVELNDELLIDRVELKGL